jgi:hypothetical protein
MLNLLLLLVVPLFLLGCEQPDPYTPPTHTAEKELPESDTSNKKSLLESEEVSLQDRIDHFTTKPPTNKNIIYMGSFQSPKPQSWTWSPPQSPTITCNYFAPGIENEDQVTFSVRQHEEGEGGTYAENVDRWLSFFKTNDGAPIKPIASVLEVNDQKIVIVEFQGEYMGAGASWHLRDYMLVVAEVQHEEGKLHFKLLGPRKAVEVHRPHFEQVILSMERSTPSD